MPLYTLPNETSGFDAILIETVAQVPLVTPLLLTFVFFVVFLGGIGQQKARIGTAHYSMWSVVASIATFIIALILTTITGLIKLDVLAIVISVTILSGVWFFFDNKEGTV